MPGHVAKTTGPDPCPDQWLYVSDDLKVIINLATPPKGQIKLVWKYEIENFPHYQWKNLMDFCPASLHRLGTYDVIFFQGNSSHSGVCIT